MTILVGMKGERKNLLEITGKQALFVINLPPRKMLDFVSEGMFLISGIRTGSFQSLPSRSARFLTGRGRDRTTGDKPCVRSRYGTD